MAAIFFCWSEVYVDEADEKDTRKQVGLQLLSFYATETDRRVDGDMPSAPKNLMASTSRSWQVIEHVFAMRVVK